MGSDESTAQEGRSSAGIGRGGEEGPSPTDKFVSQSKTCPECGEPLHDVRKACPNCGYEYKKRTTTTRTPARSSSQAVR